MAKQDTLLGVAVSDLLGQSSSQQSKGKGKGKNKSDKHVGEIEHENASELGLLETEVCFVDKHRVTARLAKEGQVIFVIDSGSMINVVPVEVLQGFGLDIRPRGGMIIRGADGGAVTHTSERSK